MNIKLELLKNEISELVINSLSELNLNAYKIADTTAISALSEIHKILKMHKSDFEIVEEIVCVFEKYNLDYGECHDI